MTQTFQSFNGDKINQYLIRINCDYYTFTATHSRKIPAQKITKDLCRSNKMGVR